MRAFTLIEILIVISIIGILATIVVVSYRGITGNAAATVLKSDIKEAVGQLNLAKASDGVYPANTSNLSRSDGTTYQYTVIGGDYCLTATSLKAGVNAYHLSSTSVGGVIEDGVCSGHILPSADQPDVSLVGWWKLNGNANDSSGNGNNGVVAGAVQTTGQTSAPNTAYAFSASAAAQVLTFTSSGSLGANITASAWVRPTSYPTERSTIIESINPYAYYVSLNTDGSLQSYRFGTNPAGYHTTAAGTVPLNQWTHVAITWDSLSVNLYINGVLQRTAATTGTGVTGSQIIVGAESVSRQFIGSIDDVRIYNRTLPQTDVAKLYSAGAK